MLRRLLKEIPVRADRVKDVLIVYGHAYVPRLRGKGGYWFVEWKRRRWEYRSVRKAPYLVVPRHKES